MYSGKTPLMEICINDRSKIKALEKYFSIKDYRCICKGNARIALNSWLCAETKVYPYPQ